MVVTSILQIVKTLHTFLNISESLEAEWLEETGPSTLSVRNANSITTFSQDGSSWLVTKVDRSGTLTLFPQIYITER